MAKTEVINVDSEAIDSYVCYVFFFFIKKLCELCVHTQLLFDAFALPIISVNFAVL